MCNGKYTPREALSNERSQNDVHKEQNPYNFLAKEGYSTVSLSSGETFICVWPSFFGRSSRFLK